MCYFKFNVLWQQYHGMDAMLSHLTKRPLLSNIMFLHVFAASKVNSHPSLAVIMLICKTHNKYLPHAIACKMPKVKVNTILRVYLTNQCKTVSESINHLSLYDKLEAHWACIAHLTLEWYWSKFQKEIIITLKNSSHLEWRVGLSDKILKGTHPGTIYARFGPYIDASCQVWLHFAKQFQRRRFF